MKRVEKGDAPASFEDYRVQNPDEVRVPGNQADGVWNLFKSNRTRSEDVYDALANESGGLCAYCEQRLFETDGEWIPLDRQIEHFLPKSNQTPSSPRVLEWDNLLLCCTGGTRPELQRRDDGRYRPSSRSRENESCGQYKKNNEPADTDHLVRSPLSLKSLPPIVELGLEGRLFPNQALSQATRNDVEKSIKNLNLNCPRLCDARERVRKQMEEQLEWLQETFEDWKHLEDHERLDIALHAIGSELRPDGSGWLQSFWTVRRLVFGALAEQWLMRVP